MYRTSTKIEPHFCCNCCSDTIWNMENIMTNDPSENSSVNGFGLIKRMVANGNDMPMRMMPTKKRMANLPHSTREVFILSAVYCSSS